MSFSPTSAPSRPSSESPLSINSSISFNKCILLGALLMTTGISYYTAMRSAFLGAPDVAILPPSLSDETRGRNTRVLMRSQDTDELDVTADANEQIMQERQNANDRLKVEMNQAIETDEQVESETKNTGEDIREPNKQPVDTQENVNHTKPSSNEQTKPLNILLLYGDDWRHDSLGVASNGLVKTPFLDKLATQGVRFTHNCVTTSVCWISRATLYTGQYVSRHESTDPGKPEFYSRWDQTFPHLLREAGYYFGHVGKWHFKGTEDFVKPRLDFARFHYGSHWYNDHKGGKIHSTKRNEKDAIDFLRQRPKDKPFCLTVCFFTPHADDGNPLQYSPQNESMALYVNDTIPRAPSATEEAWTKLPKFFGNSNEGRNRFFWRFDTNEKYQSMMKNYYRLISEIDASSERIVKELEDQGVLDDTLVIFTTDNGYFHAEHGLADKWYPYQESIRVPMIVRDPRMSKERVGTLNSDFTLSVDLAPTILGAAGRKTPKTMQGRDFSSLYMDTIGDEKKKWRNEFFYEHPVHLRQDIIPASEALVRKDYKYMLWPNYNVEQLFDLRNDTYELNDLINSTSHRGLLDEMRVRFNELKKRAK